MIFIIMTFLHRTKENENGKTMEKDAVSQMAVFWCRLITGFGVSGFGGQFMSSSVLSFSHSLSLRACPSSSLGFPKDRVAFEFWVGIVDIRLWNPFWSEWVITVSTLRELVPGCLVALCSMTFYGIALYASLNDLSLLKFLPWVFPNSFKTSEKILVYNVE